VEKMDMKIQLYNYISRKKETFRPLKKGVVRFYACGPTVYSHVHIGNLRTYIFEDILRRILAKTYARVKHIVNITDVDDKIIKNAGAAHQPIGQYTAPFEASFKEDAARLNILPASAYTKATAYIPHMITLIQKLLAKGIAYKADGSVYFDISKFPAYGALSRLGKRSLTASARIDADEYQKDSAQDFVLWKAAKEGEPSWPAPFGPGRPGWHIECSVMAMKKLGTTIDIHAGGTDLLFPHHENEIAQSVAATGKPFVRYIVEGEHLLVDGQKMSKSLGNTFTLRDIMQKGFQPLDFRYVTLTAHYRTPLNFTWQSLTSAAHARKDITLFVEELVREKKASKKNKKNPYASYQKKFLAAVSDDLNVPKALAIVWKFIRAYRSRTTTHPHAAHALLVEFDAILGLGLRDRKPILIPVAIQRLADKREKARKSKFWLEADRLRMELEKKGWQVNDTPEGPKLFKQ
jgi:cysteinyl-tRNA synthetase